MRAFVQRPLAFAISALAVALAGPVLAQEASGGAPADGATEAPEEITIVGGRPLSDYRLELEEARLALVDAYNEANSSDANDVTCRNERATGTRMPQRVCRSKAQSDAEASASMNFLRSLTHSAGNFRSATAPGGPQLNASIGAAAAQSSAEVLSAESRAAIEAELETLKKENRQVYRAVVKYLELEDEYNRARGAVAE